jgi:peptide/nickel transport system permease protein
MPKPVFLATDLALYVLLVAIVYYVWHALRTPTLRQTWRSVLHDPVAMSASVVLGLFLLLALLDSIHFRSLLPPAPGAAADAAPAYSTRTLSVLDALFRSARGTREVLLGSARHA